MSTAFEPTSLTVPAVVTIDMHRGHLDPEIATMPLPRSAAARVVDANIAFLAAARSQGLPIVHVVTVYRDANEIHNNPFWKAIDGTSSTRGRMTEHNRPGSRGAELMPGIEAPGDYLVTTKKRYDCFRATELDFVLRRLGTNTLLITGVNTNSCVLATTIVAQTRDYAPIVISDCVDTLDGAPYHEMALGIVERAFGWVMPWRDALQALRSSGSQVGASRRPTSLESAL